MATQVTGRYCPICGSAVTENTHDRFGEWCCSEAHAEEYVAEVRALKQRQAAVPPVTARAEPHRGGCCG